LFFKDLGGYEVEIAFEFTKRGRRGKATLSIALYGEKQPLRSAVLRGEQSYRSSTFAISP